MDAVDQNVRFVVVLEAAVVPSYSMVRSLSLCFFAPPAVAAAAVTGVRLTVSVGVARARASDGRRPYVQCSRALRLDR